MTAPFSRPDATGRSSSAPLPRVKNLLRLPAPFVAIPVEVMRSDAYRTLNIQGRRVLDALLVEHASHASRENGRLIVTYDQLQRAYGMSRRKIAPAIKDLEQRGLIRRTAEGYATDGKRQPSLYRLTFLASLPDREGPSGEWRKYKKPSGKKEADPEPASAMSGNQRLVPVRRPHGGSNGA